MVRSNERDDSEDFERRWESITSELGDLQMPGIEADDEAEPTPAAAGEPSEERPAIALSGPRDYEPPEVEEHFIPPDPKISAGSPIVRLGWIGVVGSLVFLLLALIFHDWIPSWWAYIALAVFAASVVLLLSRVPFRRSDDSDRDNGAQV